MTLASHKAIALQFYQCFDERRIEDALDLLAPNFIAHLAGVPEPLDKDGFTQFGLSFYSAFRDGHHVFDEVIVSDDKVITSGTFTAKHLGGFQGLPPTGKTIQISIMHIDRIENGEIVEHWGQGDTMGLMQQLGIIFFPGPKLLPALIKSLSSNWLKSNA